MRSPFIPKPGIWYFTVKCRTCLLYIRFFVDETKGVVPIRAKKQVHVICLNCQNKHLYSTTEMTSSQEPFKLAAYGD